MNRQADNEQLLNDIIAESAPADFRGAMLGEALRLARVRRRSGQMRRAGVLIAAVLVVMLVWQQSLQRPKETVRQPVVKRVPLNYTLVSTAELSAAEIITTQPILAGHESGTAKSVAIVETSTGNFRYINDDELLAMLSRQSAILIRTGPQTEELVFANSDTSKN